MRPRSRIFALALASPLILAGGVLSTATAQATPQATAWIAGSAAPGLAHAQSFGAMSDNTRLSVAVAMKLRDEAGLDRFIAQVGDPHSAFYRHYLSPAQFLDRYGPTRESVNQVRQYLEGAGLTVTGVSANRQVVDATGSVSQLRTAFGTAIGRYYDSSTHRSFYANTSAVTLPAGIASTVQGIAGLDNHYVPHRDVIHRATPHSAAQPNGGYGPTDFRGAYHVPGNLDGSGVSVDLWEFDAFPAGDITAYDQQYGLNSPAPQVIGVDGGQSGPAGGEDEVDLDIETIQGLAPAARQYVYEAPEPGNDDNSFQKEEIDEANQIVSDKKATIVSMSWGLCETQRDSSMMASEDNAFKQGTAEGIGWFAASGDDGSDDCGDGSTAVDYPASDPYVTGVGGTTLTVDNGSYGGETAWSGSGGGTSVVYGNPSWQAGDNGKRTVPDVAADADPNTGAATYSDGQWGVVGGTSLAAPLWAGFAALYDQQAAADGKAPLGFGSQAIYGVGNGSSYSSAMNDVTSGGNGSFGAGQGYDQVTGWGSYDTSGLISALGG